MSCKPVKFLNSFAGVEHNIVAKCNVKYNYYGQATHMRKLVMYRQLRDCCLSNTVWCKRLGKCAPPLLHLLGSFCVSLFA